jgi:hypothetical protein
MRRATLRGMQRDAAVVLDDPSPGSGQAALAEDVDVLEHALDDPEPLVREHAASALARLRAQDPAAALRARHRAAGARRAGAILPRTGLPAPLPRARGHLVAAVRTTAPRRECREGDGRCTPG